MVHRTSAKCRNQFVFRHSSRNRPLSVFSGSRISAPLNEQPSGAGSWLIRLTCYEWDRTATNDFPPAEMETLLERVRLQQWSEQDFHLLERLLRLLLSLVRIISQKQASLARLKQLLFGSPPDPPSLPPPASPTTARTDQETAPPEVQRRCLFGKVACFRQRQ